MAIKEGADAQHQNHTKQIERLEAERSERSLLRKRVETVDAQILGKKHIVKADRPARYEIHEEEQGYPSSSNGGQSDVGEHESTTAGFDDMSENFFFCNSK